MAKALIVIDFINEIVHSNGKLAQKGYASYIEHNFTFNKINTLMRKARELNIPIIFIKLGFHDDYSDCPLGSPLFSTAPSNDILKFGTWSTEFHEDLQIKEGDIIIKKPRVSSFFDTLLDVHLGGIGVDTIYLAGVSTDLAVEATARDAHDRDYTVVVVEDCCAAASGLDHKNSLETMKKFATVVHSEEVEF